MTKISPLIVYLDQCHWITLARARFARHKIPSSNELAAADFILKAVGDGRIRLPLSGAHMIETAKAGDGLRRHQLADTMLSVYENWYMSDPVVVRGGELARALSQQDTSLDRDQVFNQRPWTPFGNYIPNMHNDQTLPPQVQRLVDELPWRLAWQDMLRSGTYEATEWAAALKAIQRWAWTHQDLVPSISVVLHALSLSLDQSELTECGSSAIQTMGVHIAFFHFLLADWPRHLIAVLTCFSSILKTNKIGWPLFEQYWSTDNVVQRFFMQNQNDPYPLLWHILETLSFFGSVLEFPKKRAPLPSSYFSTKWEQIWEYEKRKGVPILDQLALCWYNPP